MAAAAGLEYHLDQGRHANTFAAHALIKAADRQGRLSGAQPAEVIVRALEQAAADPV